MEQNCNKGNHMKRMISALLSVLFVCCVQQAVAWNIAVKNLTQGELVAKFSYAACGTLERVIPAWQSGEPFRLDNGGCCPFKVEVRSTTGPARGLEAKYFPPTTGLGISCRNNEVTFQLTGDKKQIVSLNGLAQKDASGMTNFHLRNTTNSQLVVDLRYTVAAACMPETRLVEPGTDLDLQIGLCCLGSINIQARGGSADGKKYNLKPGGPSGCGTLVVHTVKTDGSGNLVVETGN